MVPGNEDFLPCRHRRVGCELERWEISRTVTLPARTDDVQAVHKGGVGPVEGSEGGSPSNTDTWASVSEEGR
ncbi:hypothetical protein [Nonomuraea sp. NPDC005650]|uniref:hypothetical protein n=1 Tax=Nonomuraea sp. NPDC005650 TaxID=3157045 RepID=UPI0033BD3BEB